MNTFTNYGPIFIYISVGWLDHSVAGPAVWNSLPTDIRSAPTLCTFKNWLKTYLLLQSYFIL